MNTELLETYLANLGKTHGALVTNGIVPTGKFIEVYPGAWNVYLEPAEGVSLRFWSENKRFESVIFSLVRTSASSRTFEGTLPDPYGECKSRETTLALLGQPIEAKEPFKMPPPMGDIGGWDKFSLSAQGYEGLVLIVNYDTSLNVTGMAFAIKQTGFDLLDAEYQSQSDE